MYYNNSLVGSLTCSAVVVMSVVKALSVCVCAFLTMLNKGGVGGWKFCDVGGRGW
jgi:hypothetical protein